MDRRRLLQGAAAATTAGVLLPAARAQAAAFADTDHPSAHWTPATTANYTASDRPSSYPVQLVVIHVTQETFADTIAHLPGPGPRRCPRTTWSAPPTAIAQCVREHDIAWHAGNWDYNTRSIGIEHEGWVDQPSYFTDALYDTPRRSPRRSATKYGIPKDRNHIIGHNEVPGADHTDPGPWDWVRYIRLVNFA